MIGKTNVQAKLYQVLGRARADAVLAEAMQVAGVASISTADDQLRIAVVLIERGGVMEAVGRALKIQAILNGASEG